MTILVRGNNSYFMGAQAFLLDDERETASDWASKYIQHNPAIKWVLGRFVEANNPNNNMQAWSLEDLRIARPTINHAPMNVLHQPKHIVGAFVANELIYSMDEDVPDEAYAGINNPYVEVLGAFWKYYFPDELEVVQKAHDEGKLFYSMECVAETITFEDTVSGKTQEFPYRGPRSETYGDWNGVSHAIRWLNKPHFLGGALIIPPGRPGWSNADIKALAQYTEEHQEVAETVYNGVKEQAPHLSNDEIEQITLALLSDQVTDQINDLVKNSNSTDHLSMIGTSNQSSDETASDVSHPEGGEMSTESKTYTEDELTAAVNAAVQAALEPVTEELNQLRAKAADDAVEARLEEMKAEFEGKIEEIQQALDASVIEAQTAKEERDAIIAWLEGVAEETAELAARAEREEARLAMVKEVANFPEEFIASQTERWVAMSDEDFEALVDGYKAAAEAAKTEKEANEGENPFEATAMKAGREDSDTQVELGTVRGIMAASRQGRFDPRTV